MTSKSVTIGDSGSRAGPDAGSGSLEAAHRALLEDRSIQFHLVEPDPAPEIPAWLRWLGKLIEGVLPAAEYLFWGLAAGAVLLIAFLMLRRGVDWRPWRRRVRPEEEIWTSEESGPARQLLREADALAAEARYSEASHLLLFRSIEELESRRPGIIRPSLTSRDIAALPDLPPTPRNAFARLASLVERSLFGGRDLKRQDWLDCRSAYESFAFAEAWRG